MEQQEEGYESLTLVLITSSELSEYRQVVV